MLKSLLICMSDTNPTQQSSVQDQAIAWYVRLKDPIATAADRQAFQHWLQADTAHQQAFAQVQQLWQQLAEPAQQLGRGQWYRRQPTAMPWFRRFSVVSSMASCVALLVVCLFWWQDPGMVQRWQADYATVPGQQAEFSLSDGSRIFLGDDTALKIDMSQPASRQITLLRGRAWFDVTPDPQRPFAVQHHDLSVTVLGTAFTVSAYGKSRSVAVEHGKVATYWQGETAPSYQLTSGQTVRYQAGLQPLLAEADIDMMQAWRRGLYVFDRVPLAEVIATLESAVPGRLLLSEALQDIPVTGIFQRGEPEQILNGLTRSLNLKTQHIPGLGTRIYRE